MAVRLSREGEAEVAPPPDVAGEGLDSDAGEARVAASRRASSSRLASVGVGDSRRVS